MSATRPLVGLLYNPAVPLVIAAVPSLVESIAVMPDRLWYDFGAGAAGRRFHRALGAIAELRECAAGRVLCGHGIGLSLPSAMPLDEPLLDEVASLAAEFDLRWYSEHLSVFLTPQGSVPNAQAGLGLPVPYDGESYVLLRDKVRRLQDVLRCPILLENGSIFTPIPDMEMSEPEFLNRLFAETGCETLLDLQNLHVTWRNTGLDPWAYLDTIDPEAVTEIHLGGGDELDGFYTDSHSRLTPPGVWAYAEAIAPRCPRLRAITFEFHETYYERLGEDGIADELRRMHALADRCQAARSPAYAG